MNFTDPHKSIQDATGDEDGDGIRDEHEQPVDGSDVDPVVRRKPSWFRRTLAGETRLGEAGSVLKNIFKHFVPYGHQIDSVTDAVGDQLKTEKRSMLKKAIKRAFTTDGGSFGRLVDEKGRFSLDYTLAFVARCLGVSAGLILIFWVCGKLGIPVDPVIEWFLSIINVSP